MSHYKKLDHKLLTLPTALLSLAAITSLTIIGYRFLNGLGSVTNLNDVYPWGIWVAFDIVVGTAFACGGYALALVVYILNKGKYHPLIRPALLTSLLGYAMGAVSAFIDMGRFYNFYYLFNPNQINLNSVMLEIALCVMAYILVMFIEFMPAMLEKFKKFALKEKLEKVLFVFIAIGALLPTMHQSSLGSLLIAAGQKVYPLWQSLYFQPILALSSAIIMGMSIVIWEGSMVTVVYKRQPETHLLKGVGQFALYLLLFFLVIRLFDITNRGVWGLAFQGDYRGNMFLLEMVLFLIPTYILISPSLRKRGPQLMVAGTSLLLAGALYRLNAFLIGWVPNPADTYSYFPSVPELMVTIGLVALELLVYVVVIKMFPIWPKEHGEAAQILHESG